MMTSIFFDSISIRLRFDRCSTPIRLQFDREDLHVRYDCKPTCCELLNCVLDSVTAARGLCYCN